MLALQFNAETGEADLIYEGGRLVDEGHDLETAALLSLFCDARADEGDVPDGTPRRGFWGDAFDDDDDVLGSLLWLLEDQVAIAENASRAETYTKSALTWMLTDDVAVRIEEESELKDAAIYVGTKVYLRNGGVERLGPFQVT